MRYSVSERRVLNFRSQKSELLIFNLRVTVARYYFGSLFLFYFDRVCLLLQLLLIVYFWLDIVYLENLFISIEYFLHLLAP